MSGKLLKVFSLMFVFVLGACSSTQYSTQEKIDAALLKKADVITEYKIGPTDQLLVNVWRNDELSISVPVRVDGKISIPLVGDVNASELTPEQLALDIETKLGDFIREPKVTVVVIGMGSHDFRARVRITGAVRQPQSITYHEGMTILDLVLTAGGVNEFASSSGAVLYRQNNNEVVAIPVDVESILSEGLIGSNYALQPGDIVTIPEKVF